MGKMRCPAGGSAEGAAKVGGAKAWRGSPKGSANAFKLWNWPLWENGVQGLRRRREGGTMSPTVRFFLP